MTKVIISAYQGSHTWSNSLVLLGRTTFVEHYGQTTFVQTRFGRTTFVRTHFGQTTFVRTCFGQTTFV